MKLLRYSKDAGATVDFKEKVVKIPESLIERTIRRIQPLFMSMAGMGLRELSWAVQKHILPPVDVQILFWTLGPVNFVRL
jgi:trimethylamine:corrinoid methyltransferase-like protein